MIQSAVKPMRVWAAASCDSLSGRLPIEVAIWRSAKANWPTPASGWTCIAFKSDQSEFDIRALDEQSFPVLENHQIEIQGLEIGTFKASQGP